MEIKQRSAPQRQLWAQFDALQMGSGWDEDGHPKAPDLAGGACLATATPAAPT